MAFGSRLLILAIVPLVTLIAFRSYIPDYDLYSSLSNKVLDNLPPRWETPIIVSAFTHWSHYEKVAKVALVLAELGYPITFVTGRVFEKDATKLHPLITFQPLLGGDDKMSQEDYEIYESKTPGLERELFIMKVALMGSMKPTHDTLQQVFRDFREKHGDTKPLISLFDTPVIGHHPILLGAPGIKPDSSIVINCHPLVMDSNDTFPPFAGKMPHTGPDAKVIHQQANLEWRDDYQTITLSKWYWEALENLGAQTDRLLMDSMHALPDQILSLGVPEFEFPRSDLRKNVHYFGAMRAPKQARTAQPDIPIWWKDILQAKQAGKKIVAVSQGTVETDLSNLVLPTLEALKDRDDVLVIATTVAVEPAEVPDLVVPYNARVAKFVPYDLLLPMVDVLVNNGGYGAVIQALEQGIPLVVAGEGQDKAITNAIIQWSGVGVHVGGRSPGPGKIREGLRKVLDDERYTQKAKAMSKNFERYDVEIVADSVIQDVVRKWAAKRP